MVSDENIYRQFDKDADEVFFSDEFANHLDRMTVEDLHIKADIAGELAYRDIQIQQLEADQTNRLTKREYFAGLAMQGLLSEGVSGPSIRDTADTAVHHADALLTALEADKDG